MDSYSDLHSLLQLMLWVCSMWFFWHNIWSLLWFFIAQKSFFSSQRLSLSFSGAFQNPHIYFHLHPSPFPVFFSSLVWQFIFISILWLRYRQILFFHDAIFLSLRTEGTSKKLFLAAKSCFLCLRKKSQFSHSTVSVLCSSSKSLALLHGNF